MRVCSRLLILEVTKCFGQNYSFLLLLRRRLVTIHFPPTAKEDKARKGLHRTIETVWKSCYPVRHEIYWLKSFLGASGAGMGFDKSEREIVISLSVCRRTGGTSRLGMAKGVTCFVLPQHCFPRWCDQLPLNKRWTSNSVRITTAVFQFGMRNRKLVILPLPGGAGMYHLVLKHTTSSSRSELNSVWYWLTTCEYLLFSTSLTLALAAVNYQSKETWEVPLLLY